MVRKHTSIAPAATAHGVFETRQEAQAKVRRALGAQRFEDLRSQLSGVVAMAKKLTASSPPVS